jgi:hypothetical protein
MGAPWGNDGFNGKGVIPNRQPPTLQTVSDSSLLGFWRMAPSGLPEASPRWSGPALPGEPSPRPAASRKRPTLPGEALPPLPYRQTRSGHVVAWDEPGETF